MARNSIVFGSFCRTVRNQQGIENCSVEINVNEKRMNDRQNGRKKKREREREIVNKE